jgi:site-specific DNA-methyltransferase (adenine-specific)
MVWASKGAMGTRDVCLPGVFPHALDMPKKHLTEKPVDLAREVVRLVPEGGVVCDLFAGSGTFLLAAKDAGLRWIGCETSDSYYYVATQRLHEG